MFSMFRQLTQCSPIQDGRMELFVEPCLCLIQPSSTNLFDAKGGHGIKKNATFSDALASLDFKLTVVSESVMFLQQAHLRVFQIFLSKNHLESPLTAKTSLHIVWAGGSPFYQTSKKKSHKREGVGRSDA